MTAHTTYNLVHITTDGEYKAPLVASQLFDQAQCQASASNGFSPGIVDAWIIEPFREKFNSGSKSKIQSLQKRCPDIHIKMFGGISRLNNFPVIQRLKGRRLELGKSIPVIYHCRGEGAAWWALKMKSMFPQDKVVLDVRGYWPAELLYNRGIQDPYTATGKDQEDFNSANTRLRDIIGKVDAVTTVSPALKQLLVDQLEAPVNTCVVPCCVMNVATDDRRAELRKQWGVSDNEIIMVYSGTAAPYQHLEDLTLPFLKKLKQLNHNIRIAILSPETDKIKAILQRLDIQTGDVIIGNYPQKEVAAILTACDAGILIRKPTLVNRVANPVKIAEYMASGLPVIVEKGVGGIPDFLKEMSIVEEVEITAENSDIDKGAETVNQWLQNNTQGRRDVVRKMAEEHYLWKSAINTSREMYRSILNNQ